ncbi:hypothetical protein F2Q69_00006943 [Brassica cretica]|uniref:Uncharacterized protein n=1 Tax=Brassica cretica TaxID=69181 RepID=A0A8S9P5A3_BRACR|nr:hypothetical protein F2Q69_00006943 [Brassica cretica]
MSASMKANRNMYLLNAPTSNDADQSEDSEGDFRGTFSDCPTVFRASFSEPCSSGTVRKRAPIRRRPPRAQRQRNLLPLPIEDKTLSGERREGKQEALPWEYRSQDARNFKQVSGTVGLFVKQALMVVATKSCSNP